MTSQSVRSHMKILLLIWITVVSVFLIPAQALRAASLPTSSAASLAKAGKKKLSGIVKIKKNWYYMKKGRPVTSKNGKVVTLILQKEEDGTRLLLEKRKAPAAESEAETVLLFVEKNGTLIKGWHQLDNKLYYTKAKGVIQVGGQVDGITINGKGWAKATAANLRKLPKSELDQYAEKLADSVAGSISGRSGKLRAIWNFMSSHSHFRYIRIGDSFSPSTAKSRALSMLRNRGGNCFDFALAFAALCKAIGYDAYMIYGWCPAAAGGMTTHGWVYLSGAGYFDVEGEFAGWGRGVYGYSGNPYSESGRIRM